MSQQAMSQQAVASANKSVAIDGNPTLEGRRLNAQDLPEVSTHALDRWAALARRIRGQFSILAKAGALSIGVTDMTGSYPVFMTTRGTGVELGGTLESAMPESRLALNREAAARYVACSSVGAGHTLIDGISTLPGASIVMCEGKDTRITGWFDWSTVAYNSVAPLRELEEEFKAILASWVEVFLPKDGQIGLLLSGGTDSGVMAALLKPLLGDRLVAITQDSVSERYSERNAAAETAEAVKLPLLVAKLSRHQYFRSFMALNSKSQDAVIPFTESHNLFCLADFAREQGIHTLLTGSNADCLFLGLGSYFEGLPQGTKDYAEAISRFTPGQQADWVVGKPSPPSPFSLELLAVLGVPVADYHAAVEESYALRRRRIEAITPLVDLPTLQRIEFAIDGGFAWHGRQGALPVMRALPGCNILCPFYDPEIIKFAIKLPKELVFCDGQTKYFLRRLLKTATGLDRQKRAGSLSPLRYWRIAPNPREYATVTPGLRALYRRHSVRNWTKLGGLYNDLTKIAGLGIWMKNHRLDVPHPE